MPAASRRGMSKARLWPTRREGLSSRIAWKQALEFAVQPAVQTPADVATPMRLTGPPMPAVSMSKATMPSVPIDWKGARRKGTGRLERTIEAAQQRWRSALRAGSF
jgi:hypothetical protein